MAKPKMVKTEWDRSIAERAKQAGHSALAVWACDCAERVLPCFESQHPDDPRPRQAIEAGRRWAATGIFKMADIRGASLSAHAAARAAAEGSAARAAARAAGQAAASAHVSGHALAAAIYAATAARDGGGTADAPQAVDRERKWQMRHLKELSQRSSP